MDRADVSARAGERGGLLEWIIARRFVLSGVADAAIVMVSVLIATILRHEFDLDAPDWAGTALFGTLAVSLHLLLGYLDGVYRGVARFGSFDELAGLVRPVIIGVVISAGVNLLAPSRMVPASVSFAYGAGALVAMLALRYLWRLTVERRGRRRPDPDDATRVVVYGAGEDGHQIITAMLRNPDSRYYPVALLDDDPKKANLRISGVPVLGQLDALGDVATAVGAEALVIAIPSADPQLVRRADEIARSFDLSVFVLPPVDDVLDGHARMGDIRPVSDQDLPGRGSVDTDIDSIAGYLTGKRVLVTGAGGSIGSELCRQIHRFDPEELVMLDRDESLLQGLQLSIDGRGLLDTRALVLADIRDAERVAEVFDEWRPQVVFHAAALKHLPLLEMHPDEAYKTNVVGTQNLLDCAAEHGVERFVNISTDKAADPVNVLGRTKREAELRTAAKARQTGGCFMSVRFGNVLGSRGSVVITFREQIAAGGPVTVTHPDVTRYFMTIAEAVELVIQAGAIGTAGEILILEMGEPVKIADLARRMIEADGNAVPIEFTGLRPGERLHEVLVSDGEQRLPGPHPLITHVRVGPPAASPLGDVLESAEGW